MSPWPKLVVAYNGSCQKLEKTFHLATLDHTGLKKNLEHVTRQPTAVPDSVTDFSADLFSDPCDLPLELRLRLRLIISKIEP